ncbi:PLAC8-domain-containing protein [Coprinopsis marcescibilis]|uniref:PLAC8-domain-containing protein n=1 Tax=Coprinopsis marcescibilis TaxID=230819 RepID=A0A5C3KQZ4_COPMA|nr:PLAC8-domain-containing protein [Coprinopsis marcescibilis]
MAYKAQPQMVIVQGGGGNRNAKNLPVTAGGRDWSHGLCDCCSAPGTCIVACCFPCITYGKNKNRFKHLSAKGVPHPDGGGCCTGDCCIHFIVASCGIACLLQCMSRGETRTRYNIKGSGCGDCCTACFCTPCDLVQESREIELEEQSMGYLKH